MEEWPREGLEVRAEPATVRGTQSFVETLSWCWGHPRVVGREVLWRWVYGIPVLWAVVWNAIRVVSRHTGGTMDVGLLGLDPKLVADPVGALAGDPLGVVRKVTGAAGVVLPDLLQVGVVAAAGWRWWRGS